MAWTQAQIDAEIQRKAYAGEQMDSPTPEKEAKYKQYQDEARGYIAKHVENGTKMHDPNPWKQGQYDQMVNERISNQTNDFMSQFDNSEKLSQLERYLRESADGMFAQQEAMLGQARDEQIAQLEKAYADAIAQGTISVRDAEAQFQEQLSVINQNAYQDAQRTQLLGTDMGIQNSQQMVGMMQGDNARKNSMINQNMTTRDKRVNDIKDRINAIKANKDLDIASANANYNYGVAGARGQIDSQMYQNMFDMHSKDMLQQNQNAFNFGLNQMNQFNNMQNQNQQQQFTLEQMAKQYGYDISKMDKDQINRLEQMAKQHGYDLDAMSQSHNNNLDLNSQKYAQDLSMMREQSQLRMQEELQAYDLAVERELAKYQPGTKEYEIRKGQLLDERDSLIAEIHASTMYDFQSKHMLEGGAVANPGKKPEKKWYHLPGTLLEKNYKEDVKKWEENKKKYDAYTRKLEDFKNSPTGNTFP